MHLASGRDLSSGRDFSSGRDRSSGREFGDDVIELVVIDDDASVFGSNPFYASDKGGESPLHQHAHA